MTRFISLLDGLYRTRLREHKRSLLALRVKNRPKVSFNELVQKG